MEADIRVYDVVDSTNIRVSELAKEGAAEGTCVVSFKQLQGQGRSGRSFFSPEGGNLYMSLLLRPKNEAAGEHITVAAAVASAVAIEKYFDIHCGIKWVNDLIYNDRKVGGMVAQAHNYGSDDFYVVLGIGINIYESKDIPEDIEGKYGSLMGKGCDLEREAAEKDAVELARQIIREFSVYYDDYEGSGCAQKYRDLSVVIGRDVSYTDGGREIKAKVLDIDNEGGIVLEMSGTVRTYRDGEIRIRVEYK